MADVWDKFPDAKVAVALPQADAWSAFPDANPSIGTRIGKDLANRMQTGKDILASDNGEGTKALQYVGNVGAGLANDVVKEGVKSAVDSVPQPIKDVVSGGANAVLNTHIGQLGMGALKQGGLAWDSFSKAYPTVANDLRAVGNIAGLAGNVAAIDQIGGAVRNGVNSASNAMGNAASASKGIPSAEDVLNAGSQKYQKAYAAGAGTDAIATNNLLLDANKAGMQNQVASQVGGQDAVGKYLEGLNTIQNQPLSLQDAHALDQQLSDKIGVATRAGENDLARRFGMIQDSLRKHLMDPDPAHITGGTDGYQAWQEGNDLWSAGKKMQAVEVIQQGSVGADVPSTAIKNGAKSLLKKINKGGGMGWTDDQISALEEAAQTGALTSIMKHLGSKLVSPIIGGIAGTIVGGPVGTALGSGAGFVAGAPFRAAATALQNSKVNNVLRTLAPKIP